MLNGVDGRNISMSPEVVRGASLSSLLSTATQEALYDSTMNGCHNVSSVVAVSVLRRCLKKYGTLGELLVALERM